MATPFYILGGLVVLALALVAVRVRGRSAPARRRLERVRLEDALKHLLNCERRGRTCTLENVAGRLEVSRGVASELLTRLLDGGLARPGGAGFELTPEGRAYALRILRTHRLWERYLADRTGVPPVEWHVEAERVEHELTEADVEALSSRLGHPRYDPHGDPIPTAAGEIPVPAGVPLTRMQPGQKVLIRHLEDEPPEVFERLVSAGLAPGLAMEVVAVGEAGAAPEAGGVVVRVRGQDRTLRAVDADNVTVEPLPPGAALPSARRTLADAERGDTVRVASITPSCQGPQRRRLLDLGVVPGTLITPELMSASGDPVAYRIRGALIALRREQASWIEVEEEPVERVS